MRAFFIGRGSEPEHRRQARLAVAVLTALRLGVAPKLEQPAAVVIALLLDGALMAIAALHDDALVVGP